MSKCIISDSTCLIALDRIGQLTLLKQLFEQIYVPTAVHREFGKKVNWIKVTSVHNPIAIKTLMIQIDAGESEVIALALEMQDCVAILDDKKARRIAQDIGLKITGTVGLLLKAKKDGVIGKIKPLLDQLNEAGFHVGGSLYQNALRLANEIDEP
ncbi:MAG: DUF3368 domain-containing protein [Calditrichaeota bacterium]|nr:DUF3368 domain-containing protein [Calditrichota bacterium]MCB0307155.1 DUF3368 domain-containing protein [Calditrichota bacterium]